MKLSENVRITRLAPDNYSLEYSSFCWEPSINELQDCLALLAMNAVKINQEIPIIKKYNATVFVRHENVAIGYTFMCNDHRGLETAIGQTIFDRE